jgi:hypothetical protein
VTLRINDFFKMDFLNMTVDQASDLVREALLVMLISSAPVLGAAVIIGLTISIVQAVTQIQEQTLTFAPKHQAQRAWVSSWPKT